MHSWKISRPSLSVRWKDFAFELSRMVFAGITISSITVSSPTCLSARAIPSWKNRIASVLRFLNSGALLICNSIAFASFHAARGW